MAVKNSEMQNAIFAIYNLPTDRVYIVRDALYTNGIPMITIGLRDDDLYTVYADQFTLIR